MKKLLLIFLLAGVMSTFGMDIEEGRASGDVYSGVTH